MLQGKSIGVVVVAYNEEEFVGKVIDGIPEYVDRVYAVDDRSTDGTWEEIRTGVDRANRRRGDDGVFVEPFRAIRHEENQGVGGAIKTGYRHARDDGVDVTVVMAGDDQMDPDLLPEVVRPVVEGRVDYAKGDRLSNPEHRQGMPRFRLVGNLLLTGLVRTASGYWSMVDPANGYTAISLEALEALDFDDLYEDYGFAFDLLVKLNAEDLAVADVVMPAKYAGEESGIDLASFVPKTSSLMLRDFCWRLRESYLRERHPVAAVFGLAVLGCAAGTVAAARSLASTLRRDDDAPDRRSSAVQLLAGSVLFTLLGLALDRERNRDRVYRVDGRDPEADPTEPTPESSPVRGPAAADD
jgi:glycosyltransferase involved in cell wall biosynthesis